MENLVGPRDFKAGRFLFVKRAEADKARPGSLELEARAYHIDDVESVAYLLNLAAVFFAGFHLLKFIDHSNATRVIKGSVK